MIGRIFSAVACKSGNGYTLGIIHEPFPSVGDRCLSDSQITLFWTSDERFICENMFSSDVRFTPSFRHGFASARFVCWIPSDPDPV